MCYFKDTVLADVI